jgi:hypothetical protein
VGLTVPSTASLSSSSEDDDGEEEEEEKGPPPVCFLIHLDGPTSSARVGTNSSLSKDSDKRSVMNDSIVAFSIEI